MKKILALKGFILLVVILTYAPAFSQQWVSVCKGTNVTMYYDGNSVKYLPDNKVQVLIKTVPDAALGRSYDKVLLGFCRLREQTNSVKRNNSQEESSYSEDLLELNCRTNESRGIVKTFYDKNGNILCEDSVSYKDWTKINQNTCDRLVYEALCK